MNGGIFKIGVKIRCFLIHKNRFLSRFWDLFWGPCGIVTVHIKVCWYFNTLILRSKPLQKSMYRYSKSTVGSISSPLLSSDVVPWTEFSWGFGKGPKSSVLPVMEAPSGVVSWVGSMRVLCVWHRKVQTPPRFARFGWLWPWLGLPGSRRLVFLTSPEATLQLPLADQDVPGTGPAQYR